MKKLIALAAVAAFAAPAFAQTPDQKPEMPAKDGAKIEAFGLIDADKSGALTLAEIKLHDVAVTQADFDKYDADKNKQISQVEFEAWTSAKAEKSSPDAG
jgi:hypothetical protein